MTRSVSRDFATHGERIVRVSTACDFQFSTEFKRPVPDIGQYALPAAERSDDVSRGWFTLPIITLSNKDVTNVNALDVPLMN